jgi:drug/metabolite transporter (DMT)-like permease
MLNEEKKGTDWLLIGAFAAVYIIWGSTYLGIRYAIESFPPFFMAGTRFFAAGLILYLTGRLKGAPMPDIKEVKTSTVAGFLLLVLGNGGLVWAEQRIPSSVAALLITIEPVWIVLLLWMFKTENKPSLLTWIGIITGMAGMVIMTGTGAGRDLIHSDSLSIFAILISTLAWAMGSVYGTKAKFPSSPLVATGLQMLSGGIILLMISYLSGEFASVHLESVSSRSLWAFIYLIIFGSLIGFTAYAYLLKEAHPSHVSTYAYVNPVIAVILGVFVGNEKLTAQTMFAGALIIVAVMVIWISGKPKKALK